MKNHRIESTDECAQKKVKGSELQQEADERRKNGTGVPGETDRYRVEEDENSIYEIDLNCLNERKGKV